MHDFFNDRSIYSAALIAISTQQFQARSRPSRSLACYSLRRVCRRLHHGWCKVYMREVHGRSPGRYDCRHFGCAPSCRCTGGGRPHHVPAIGVRTDIGRERCCQARVSKDQVAFETLNRGPDTQNHPGIMANHHSGKYALPSLVGKHVYILYDNCARKKAIEAWYIDGAGC